MFILLAVEIVTIHTNPERKRGNDLATSLTLWVSVSRDHEQYRWANLLHDAVIIQPIFKFLLGLEVGGINFDSFAVVYFGARITAHMVRISETPMGTCDIGKEFSRVSEMRDRLAVTS